MLSRFLGGGPREKRRKLGCGQPFSSLCVDRGTLRLSAASMLPTPGRDQVVLGNPLRDLHFIAGYSLFREVYSTQYKLTLILTNL